MKSYMKLFQVLMLQLQQVLVLYLAPYRLFFILLILSP